MTDDGSNEPYIPEYDEPAMEVVIETLTGTTFEMTVSPVDTIQSIKNKIHRVEGTKLFITKTTTKIQIHINHKPQTVT